MLSSEHLLIVTLCVICAGIGLVIFALFRRHQRQAEAPPIDTAIFAAWRAAEAPPAAARNPSSDTSLFRRHDDPEEFNPSFRRTDTAEAQTIANPVHPAAPPESTAPVAGDTSPVLICRGFGAGFGDKIVLADVTLEIPRYGITTLMGPVSTGKSTLLRSFASLYARSELYKSWGHVSYLAAALDAGNHPPLAAQRIELTQRPVLQNLLFHLGSQLKHLADAGQRDWICQWLRELGAENIIPLLDLPFIELDTLSQRCVTIITAFAAAPPLLMLDEPTSGLSQAEADLLLTMLQRMARKMALLVVLHNQKQARKFSNSIILMAGGRVQVQCAAEAFFTAEHNQAVTQFVNTGSCALPAPDTPPEVLAENIAPPPPLPAAALSAIRSDHRSEAKPVRQSSGPRGFIWLEEGRLAATPKPGITAAIDYDLDLLTSAGITMLITLAETDLPQDALARHGLKNLFLPIIDRGVPSVAETDFLISRMRALLSAGEVLAVHCLAGLGRTGTILAAYLVKEQGLSAQAALNQIRQFNRQFVQSRDQEDFLVEYEVQQEQEDLQHRATVITK